MSSVEKLIPEIKESASALLNLMENPETDNIEWFMDVGFHLTRLSDVYNGTIPQPTSENTHRSWFVKLLKILKII